MSRQQLFFNLLNRALEEEMGLVVTTNNPRALAFNLHELQKLHSEYKTLEITVPSTEKTVIIVKKSVQLDDPISSEGDLDE